MVFYIYVCCFITVEISSLCTFYWLFYLYEIYWKRWFSISHWLQLPVTKNTFSGICSLLQVFEILSFKCVLIATLTLTFLGHPSRDRLICHRSRDHSIRTMWFPLVVTHYLQSITIIMRLRCIWVMVLTFLGHVTSCSRDHSIRFRDIKPQTYIITARC